MDDRTFFDTLFQGWTKSTGAEHRYWMPVEYDDHSGRNRIYAVAEDESRKLIASDVTDEDASFITAVHGCFGDLVKRLHTAVDESDRLDEEKDALINRVGQLEQEADEFNSIINELTEKIVELESGRV